MDAQLERWWLSGTSLLEDDDIVVPVVGLLLLLLLGTTLSVWLLKLEIDPEDCLFTKDPEECWVSTCIAFEFSEVGVEGL